MTAGRSLHALARTSFLGAAVLLAAFAWLWPSASLALRLSTLFLVGAWLAVEESRSDGRARRLLGGGLVTVALGALVELATRALEPRLERQASLVPLGLAVAWVLLEPALLRRLLRLVRVEAGKVARGRLVRTGLAVTALLTVLVTLAYDPVPGATGWTRAAHGLGAGQWMAEVFLLVLGATAVAGEATGGTLKMMLPHAYRRSDWILAKAAVLVVLAVAFVLVTAVASFLPAGLGDGLGDVTTEPLFGETAGSADVFAAAEVMRGHAATTLLGNVAAAAGVGLVGLFLSTVFEGVVAALSAAFLAFAGIRLADIVLATARDVLVQRLFAWPPVQMREVLGKLGRGLSERWDPSWLPTTLALVFVTAALLLLVAARIFRLRDVHA